MLGLVNQYVLQHQNKAEHTIKESNIQTVDCISLSDLTCITTDGSVSPIDAIGNLFDLISLYRTVITMSQLELYTIL